MHLIGKEIYRFELCYLVEWVKSAVFADVDYFVVVKCIVCF